MECIDQWFFYEMVNPDDHLDEFKEAIVSQNKIGWCHWFIGKISEEWLGIYGVMRPKPNRDIMDKELWGRKVIEYTT